jgi:hypothetical protein
MSWTNAAVRSSVDKGLWESIMRRRIIEALTYPRMLLMANLEIDECPQNGYFNPAHPDEFTVLARKPVEILYESLLFSIDYVDSQGSRANHNVRRCACESCHWVRKARRIAWEYRATEIEPIQECLAE